MLKAGRLRWLGHDLRMGPERLPIQALMSQLYGVGSARRGRPCASWEQCGARNPASLGLPTAMHDLLVPALFAVHGAPCCTNLHTPAVRVFGSAGHMLHTSATPIT
jgi:hypothetical protein